jgi:trans-aconitate methyltransferase
MNTSPVVQGFYLVPVLSTLFKIGLVAELRNNENVLLSEFCRRHGLESADLVPVVQYLSDKGAVEFDGSRISLPVQGSELLDCVPFSMLHYAYYGALFEHMARIDGRNGGPARDVHLAAQASGLINRDSTFVRVLDRLGKSDVQVVADLGCGDGTFLERCARQWPHAKLMGVDSNGANVRALKEALPNSEALLQSLADSHAVAQFLATGRPQLIFAFFVLHELAQTPAVLSRFIEAIFIELPFTRLVITEVHYPSTTQCRKHANQQFSEFKFFHALTGQALLPRTAWLRLIAALKLEVVDRIVHFGGEDEPIVESLVVGAQRA